MKNLEKALKSPQEVKALFIHGHNSLEHLSEKILKLPKLQRLQLAWCDKLDFNEAFKILLKCNTLDTLEIYYSNLKEFPVELCHLSQLKCLVLCNNQFTKLPASIGQLTSLRYLDLKYNKLIELPDSFSKLSSLEHLGLSNNELERLPNNFGDLRRLRLLDLMHNHLSGLTPSFTQLDSLEKCLLLHNPLETIPARFGDMSMKVLSIGGRVNRLVHIPKAIYNLKHLESLILIYFEDRDFDEQIQHLKQVNRLHLAGFDRMNWDSAFKKLGALKSLQKLSVTYTEKSIIKSGYQYLQNIAQLKITGIMDLEAMRYVSKLETLRSLQISSYVDSILPAEIGNLKSLEELELNTVRFSGDSLLLPAEFGMLSNLQSLKMQWTPLKPLPREFGNLANLKTLSLYVCGLKTLPESFGNLKNLESAYLAGNQIQFLPKSISALVSLEKLSLQQNELRGLPEEIGDLLHLKWLNLRSNLELRRLPASIKNLSNLEYLDIEDTQINYIDPEILDISSLKRLLVCDNLIQNKRELNKRAENNLFWTKNCRDIDKLFNNYKKLYGTSIAHYYWINDTLMLSYFYSYNEPNVIDEEYQKSVRIKILFEPQADSTYQIDSTLFVINSSYSSVWNFGQDYFHFVGEIRLRESRNKSMLFYIHLEGIAEGSRETNLILDEEIHFSKR